DAGRGAGAAGDGPAAEAAKGAVHPPGRAPLQRAHPGWVRPVPAPGRARTGGGGPAVEGGRAGARGGLPRHLRSRRDAAPWGRRVAAWIRPRLVAPMSTPLTYVYCLLWSPKRPSTGRATQGLPGLGPVRLLEAGDELWL